MYVFIQNLLSNVFKEFALSFEKFGLKKFNKNGCEESCDNYHPKACFEAMKTKTCKRDGCKFFHISGTKKAAQTVTISSPIPTSNPFSPLAGKATPNDQVFQKEKERWELAIEKLNHPNLSVLQKER